MRKLTGVLTFMVCVPLIGTIFIKPVREPWKQEDEDVSVLDESFQVVVEEEIGTFYYQPEMLTGLLMYRVIPEDTVFSSSEDYIVREDAAYDPEQEYLKALAIVCRSNIAAAWEGEQCPELLLYEQMAFEADKFYRILQTLPEDSRRVKLNEIKRAVDATKGVVITRDGAVMTAPFFTTSPSDMLVSEVGSGDGFSLNYAYELAVSGMDFYAILKYFYGDIKVSITNKTMNKNLLSGQCYRQAKGLPEMEGKDEQTKQQTSCLAERKDQYHCSISICAVSTYSCGRVYVSAGRQEKGRKSYRFRKT